MEGDKAVKRWRRRWTAQTFANFLVYTDISLVFEVDPKLIKQALEKRYPNLRIGVDKIKQLMDDKLFDETVTKVLMETIGEDNKLVQYAYALLLRYYNANMKLEVPYHKCVELALGIAKIYTPKQDIQVSSFRQFTEVQKDNIAKALLGDTPNPLTERIKESKK